MSMNRPLSKYNSRKNGSCRSQHCNQQQYKHQNDHFPPSPPACLGFLSNTLLSSSCDRSRKASSRLFIAESRCILNERVVLVEVAQFLLIPVSTFQSASIPHGKDVRLTAANSKWSSCGPESEIEVMASLGCRPQLGSAEIAQRY